MRPWAEIEAEAYRWLGTPYREAASVQAEGCDCAGLIEALARFAGWPVPDARAPDLATALAMLGHRDGPPEPGDILTLARAPGGAGEHAALLTSQHTLIHAHWSAGVVENRFGRWFQVRVADVFLGLHHGGTLWQP